MRADRVALLLVLATAGASVWLSRPRTPVALARPIATFPRDLGSHHGEDRVVTQRQRALLETDEVLLREYRDGEQGDEVLLCLAVAGANRKVAHPPEICYRGQGWTILEQATVEGEIAGRSRSWSRLRVRKGERELLVIAWYRVGSWETPSWLVQQWWGIVEEIRGSGRPSALVRFSTSVDSAGLPAAEQRWQRFAAAALPWIDQALAPSAADSQAAPPP